MKTQNNDKHDKFGKGGCFTCQNCKKLTRDCGQSSDEYCKDCVEDMQHENWHSDNKLNCEESGCKYNKKSRKTRDKSINESELNIELILQEARSLGYEVYSGCNGIHISYSNQQITLRCEEGQIQINWASLSSSSISETKTFAHNLQVIIGFANRIKEALE